MTDKFKKALELANSDLEDAKNTDNPDAIDDAYWTLDKEISLLTCFAQDADEWYTLGKVEAERESLMNWQDLLVEIGNLKKRNKELGEENKELEGEKGDLKDQVADLEDKISDLRDQIEDLENENAKQDEKIDELQTKLERVGSERDDMAEVIANARLDGAVQ